MKLLMGILLAIIALVFVPGLFWILTAGAAAYGLVVIITGGIALVIMIACVMWPSIRGWLSSRRTDAKIEQANRAFREKEKTRLEAFEASDSFSDESWGDAGARKSCGKCQMEMPISSRRCPSCGHRPQLSEV
ncbi:hypothetical protein [Pseudomonas sp. S32]|uniref:hypothetical protein n=1 Tax=Pseudomonas sp. S32 TaxID=2767448 RepID=UPI001913D6D2|nr:hypothetical protein [Pseudomonas sp. S32]